ncbi:preprotein translocase subunit YajC [Cohnella thailandensis]|uniref:Preprotein translocase subunit YajC n=1 Tax=Cohnella thailandensis TaxID=557557 RepID=A0A841SSJ2_9BACL|nr:preprotein translocase subunit YajC [Cohnella thailandensis]MBB6633949.1 preprotein translocase subunit YajC [Cohnella thailandensis]MBP1972632.1 preprotein translocase subunit YajC [Cohnella thailandensis]
MATLLPFVLMFVIFYFLLIRPQQKKTKARNAMLRALKKGDKITTIGGLHGTIAEITDDTVVLKVNDVTKLTFDRSAINNVVEASPASAKSETKAEAKAETKAEKAEASAES